MTRQEVSLITLTSVTKQSGTGLLAPRDVSLAVSTRGLVCIHGWVRQPRYQQERVASAFHGRAQDRQEAYPGGLSGGELQRVDLARWFGTPTYWVVGGFGPGLPSIPVAKLSMDTAGQMLGIMLVTGVAVGVVGSVTSLRRYLNV